MRDTFRNVRNRRPWSWSSTGQVKRDLRHIHWEEEERHYKKKRRKIKDRSRCKHEMINAGGHAYSFYTVKIVKCKLCDRTERTYSYSDQYREALRKRAVAEIHKQYPPTAIYGRTHHGKYRRNRERLVQQRGF